MKLNPFGLGEYDGETMAGRSHAKFNPFGEEDSSSDDTSSSSEESAFDFGMIPTFFLNLKMNEFKWIDVFTGPSKKPPQYERLRYYCFHCPDGDEYETVQKVYNHWWTSHSGLETKESFRYFASESAECYFCGERVSFMNVRQHQADFHTLQIPIVLVSQLNIYECAICDYVGNERVAHFQSNHNHFVKTQVLQPFKLTNDALNRILGISVHKRLKCMQCDQIYDTGSEMRNHFNKDHQRVVLLKSVEVEDRRIIDHVICGECGHESKDHEYLGHLAEHFFGKCDSSITDKRDVEEIQAKLNDSNEAYFKSKAVFSNGLVMEKFNLIGTEFDDHDKYEKYMEKYF